jgi:hypothetical protein
VIRLPPPWTSTTGRRRATDATFLEHLLWSAIVVPPSFDHENFTHDGHRGTADAVRWRLRASLTTPCVRSLRLLVAAFASARPRRPAWSVHVEYSEFSRTYASVRSQP